MSEAVADGVVLSPMPQENVKVKGEFDDSDSDEGCLGLPWSDQFQCFFGPGHNLYLCD